MWLIMDILLAVVRVAVGPTLLNGAVPHAGLAAERWLIIGGVFIIGAVFAIGIAVDEVEEADQRRLGDGQPLQRCFDLLACRRRELCRKREAWPRGAFA